jgi:hypothetical protein
MFVAALATIAPEGIGMQFPQLTPLKAFTVFLSKGKAQAAFGLPKDWRPCIPATGRID